MDLTQHEQRIQTICLLILTSIALAAALYWLRPVMVPFVLAVYFALGLIPLVELQMRYLRVPRSLAILGTVVLSLVMLSLLGALVSTSVTQLTAHADAYQAQIKQLIAYTLNRLPLERFGLDPTTTLSHLSQVPAGTIGGMLLGTTNAIVELLSQGLLVAIFVVYLLIGGTVGKEQIGDVWGEVESRIERYIAVKTLTSGVTGFLTGTILAVLGVDLALVFGLLAFLLNFIPNIGPIIAVLLPLPVVLMHLNISMTVAVLAIALPAAVQFVIGNLIEPQFIGNALELHPITVLIALIFWGMLWGIVGMILATPITAVMKILFEKMELTAPIAHLLAGRLRG